MQSKSHSVCSGLKLWVNLSLNLYTCLVHLMQVKCISDSSLVRSHQMFTLFTPLNKSLRPVSGFLQLPVWHAHEARTSTSKLLNDSHYQVFLFWRGSTPPSPLPPLTGERSISTALNLSKNFLGSCSEHQVSCTYLHNLLERGTRKSSLVIAGRGRLFIKIYIAPIFELTEISIWLFASVDLKVHVENKLQKGRCANQAPDLAALVGVGVQRIESSSWYITVNGVRMLNISHDQYVTWCHLWIIRSQSGCLIKNAWPSSAVVVTVFSKNVVEADKKMMSIWTQRQTSH